MRHAIIAVLLLAALAGTAIAGQFEDAISAYKRGDYAESVHLYRHAAEQGHADAQYNLGHMYYWSEGVLQDYAEAVKWYRLAAEQGYPYAQNNLGILYGKGEGVPQDYAQAHMWFNLAAEHGHANAAKQRDIVAKRMTPTQIAEAQKLAREWKP